MFLVHADHLNTPRQVYNSSAQLRWRWDQQEPFGVNVPDEDPSSLGTFELPLRFPGQYADKETGLAYNMARDYSPQEGRYIQSDLIGLAGGLNTYLYTLASPLRFIDPMGEAVQVCAVNPVGCAQIIRLCIQATKAIAAAIAGGLIVEIVDCEKDNSCSSAENLPNKDASAPPAPPPDKKNCEALRQSILNTCYGLTGRKRMACFEVANTSYRQCMGYE